MATSKRKVESLVDEEKIKEHFFKRKKKTTAVDEEEYLAGMQDIIQRQFFPELPANAKELEFLEAEEAGDVLRMRAVEAEIQQAEGGDSLGTPYTSLDKYLSHYTSEDNRAFEDIMDRQNAHARAKISALYNQDSVLKLTQGEDKAKSEQKLLEWREQKQNTLMYVPQSVLPNHDGQVLVPKVVLAQNTRFAIPALPPKRVLGSKSSDSASSASSTPGLGYGYVTTPFINPDSTPLRLDPSQTPRHTFTIPDEPASERLGKKLADNTSYGRLGTPSRKQATPAPSRDYLAKLVERKSDEFGLAAAYQTPTRRVTTPSRTPLLSTPQRTPRHTLASTPKHSSLPTTKRITDDLLEI